MENVKITFVSLIICVISASIYCGVPNLSCNSSLRLNGSQQEDWFETCALENSCFIQIALILPDNETFVVSQKKVKPIIKMAEEYSKNVSLIPPGLTFNITTYEDSCSSVMDQIVAFHAYSVLKPNVYFGPTCEFSVSHVGNVVKFWNIPLVTIGAMTYDFNKRKTECHDEYHLLVKAGLIDFQHISNFLHSIFERYRWKKAAIVYGINDYYELGGYQTCKLMMQTYVDSLKKENQTFTTLDLETTVKIGLKESLKRVLSVEYSEASEVLSKAYSKVEDCGRLTASLNRLHFISDHKPN